MTQNLPPPILIIARIQRLDDHFIVEDVKGRFFVIGKHDAGPIRQVYYFEQPPSTEIH